MKLKNIFYFSTAALIGLSSCNKGNDTEGKTALTNQADSAGYGIGVSIGTSLKKDNMTEINPDLIAAGIKSVFNNDTSIMKAMDAQLCIQKFMQGKQEKKGADNLEKGKKCLEENAKKEGVTTLPNGLQYIVMKEGT